MTPQPGEVWLADRGDETGRQVFVISDARLHRLAERAVVAPVLDDPPAHRMPWFVTADRRAIAVHLVGSIATDRLLRRVNRADPVTLGQVRRVLRELTN